MLRYCGTGMTVAEMAPCTECNKKIVQARRPRGHFHRPVAGVVAQAKSVRRLGGRNENNAAMGKHVVPGHMDGSGDYDTVNG